MAVFSAEGISSSTILVNFTGLDTNYNQRNRICQWSAVGEEGTITFDPTFMPNQVSTYSHILSGGYPTHLRPNSVYQITCIVYLFNSKDENAQVSGTVTFQAVAITLPSLKWQWDESNGIATKEQTLLAFETITSKKSTSLFSYLVWNDMVDKVQNILNKAGLAWNNYFGSIAATKMSENDKILTAIRFNALRYNINSNSTGIPTVVKGDKVYGNYFITLTNSINSWIDALGLE